MHSENQPYRYQMPQGGIDKGEKPVEAVYREMYEEVGLRPEDVRFIASTRQWYKYDLPETSRKKKTIRGQRQKWYLFLLVSSENKIDFMTDKCQEFVDYKWVDLDEVISSVITFKQPVYEQVVAEFRSIIENLNI
jgi:putative (di)nucleoside polyphosphate hydrolase